MVTARSTAPVTGGNAGVPGYPDVDPRFAHERYVIKRPWLSFFERTFRVFGPDGRLALFVRHPIMKLRSEWQIFGDEARTETLLKVKAQQVIALNFTHDITDAATGAHVGGVRTKGLKSIIRDSMEILSPEGTVIGHVIEKGASLLRRFLPFLTSKHDIEVGGQVVAEVRQKFRFFIKEFHVEVKTDARGDHPIDPRLVLTCALLALLNEAHREDG